ncbi:MAG: sensor N-terminal transmembrane domain-containing protein, partial [Rubricella sp.]
MTNLPTGSGRKARPRSGAPRVLPRFEDAVGIKVDRDLTEDQMMSRSPIARRIFIFNMVAIGVLVAGLFLLSQQEENLIEQRTAAMVSEAESVTRTLAAFAVERDGASESIDPVRARDLVRVIARPEGSRIRV